MIQTDRPLRLDLRRGRAIAYGRKESSGLPSSEAGMRRVRRGIRSQWPTSLQSEYRSLLSSAAPVSRLAGLGTRRVSDKGHRTSDQ
jgi:hypothetical protein